MKKTILMLALGAVVAGGGSWCGCSKSRTINPPPPGNVDSNVTSAAAPEGAATMKIQWQTGKTYVMRMELQRNTETKLPNQSEPVGQEVTLTQDFDITVRQELEDGGRQLELGFAHETLEVSQGGRAVMNFDSAQSAAVDARNPAASVLRVLAGARLRPVTDAGGMVEKIDGLDELKSQIAATGSPREQAMFRPMFDEDILKQYCSFGDLLPDHAVKTGESWSSKKDFSGAAGNMTVDLQCVLMGWEQHGEHLCAHIQQTGDVAPRPGGAGAMAVEAGKITSDIWFDPQTGMVAGINNDQKMTLTVTTRGRTVHPQMDQKIRLTLVDVR